MGTDKPKNQINTIKQFLKQNRKGAITAGTLLALLSSVPEGQAQSNYRKPNERPQGDYDYGYYEKLMAEKDSATIKQWDADLAKLVTNKGLGSGGDMELHLFKFLTSQIEQIDFEKLPDDLSPHAREQMEKSFFEHSQMWNDDEYGLVKAEYEQISQVVGDNVLHRSLRNILQGTYSHLVSRGEGALTIETVIKGLVTQEAEKIYASYPLLEESDGEKISMKTLLYYVLIMISLLIFQYGINKHQGIP